MRKVENGGCVTLRQRICHVNYKQENILIISHYPIITKLPVKQTTSVKKKSSSVAILGSPYMGMSEAQHRLIFMVTKTLLYMLHHISNLPIDSGFKAATIVSKVHAFQYKFEMANFGGT